MGKNLDNFKTELKQIKDFLSARKQLGELASRANAKTTTVHETFKAKCFEDLIGKKLDVYRCAIDMVNEIKSLPQQASEAVK